MIYVLLILVLLSVSLIVVMLTIRLRRQGRRAEPMISYALRWPLTANDKLSSPAQVYKVINELLMQASKGYGADSRPRLALEIHANRSDGIRYVVSVPLSLGYTVKNYLTSYWPQLSITRLETLKDFGESSNRFHTRLWQADINRLEPVADYLLASMRGLKSKDALVYQVITRPVKTPVIWIAFSIFGRIVLAGLRFVGVIGYFMVATTPALDRYRQKQNVKVRHIRSGRDCLVTIRTAVISPQPSRFKKLDAALSAALKGNGLKPIASGSNLTHGLLTRTLDRPSKLSFNELAKVYYLSATGPYVHEEIDASGAINLAQPLTTNAQRPNEVILGINDFNAQKSAIGLSREERRRHLLILGATGMGKSTLLNYLIAQDLIAGRGLALIDPHGDLAERVNGLVPRKRAKDVIYFDPKDLKNVVGLNLLQLPSGLDGDELEIAKDFVTEAIVSIFRKIFSDDDSGGHRIEYILRNVIHTAFYVPDATLFTLHKLLTNDIFRSGVVSRLSDESLRDFWYGEFNKAGSYQRVKMISGVTAKLGRFQRSMVTRKIIEQPQSTIDFDELINSKKVLICNFSKGAVGEDTAALLGMIVIAKLQLAAWHRSLLPAAKRTPFYVYIDEFQTFASQTLSQLVSESRKYGLCLTIAEQTTANQSLKDLNILLANIAHIVAFRLAAPLDIQRLRPLFGDSISGQDFSGLEPYNFYLKIFSDRAARPISGTTILLASKRDLKF